jgi:tetratricopeptide (TPR) repeat protein
MLGRLLHRLDDAVQSIQGGPPQPDTTARPAEAVQAAPPRSASKIRFPLIRGLLQAARKRPRTALVLTALLLLVACAAGLYGYAYYQWYAALAAVKDNRAKEARSDLAVCLFLWPDSVRVHLLAARAARLSGDIPGAEAQLELCLKLGADKADVQLENLLLRVQTGEEDEVGPTLLGYVDEKHPDSTLILETLSMAYMDKLRYGPALGILNRWIAADPHAARPFQWRGWVMERLNQAEKATADYQHALELDPTLTAAHLRLADLALDNADPTTALPHLEHLSAADRKRPDVKALLGRCRFEQGLAEEARRLMEDAVKDVPDDPSLLVALGKLDLQENQPAEAEKWVRHALEVDPTDAEARYTLVGVLRFQGREEEATAALQQYEKDMELLREAARRLQDEASRPSQDPDALYQIGALFVRGGQGRVGEYWLHRALELDPRHRPTLQALADYYESKGDKDQAAPYRRQLAAMDHKTSP